MTEPDGARARPTLRDVAAAAQVSRATAGRALAGYGNVNEELTLRVRAAAEELRYRPNELARSMRDNRTRTIGVICGDIENPFFSRVVRGISDNASQHDVEVLITNTDEDQSREQRKMDVLIGKRVDGMIVYPAQGPSLGHYDQLAQHGIPVVFIDHALAHIEADAVMVDGARAAEEAICHLLDLGHIEIAMVSEAPLSLARELVENPELAFTIDTTQQRQSGARLAGYIRAMYRAGIPINPRNILSSDGYSADRAYSAVLSRFSSDRPTALFASDNVMTIGAFRALKTLRITIPAEVSLVGFDDLEWTRLVEPQLTVVSQPAQKIGQLAAEQLLRRINGNDEPQQTIFVDTQMTVRDSSAAPRE
jgi:LacI family transcriptional regulator